MKCSTRTATLSRATFFMTDDEPEKRKGKKFPKTTPCFSADGDIYHASKKDFSTRYIIRKKQLPKIKNGFTLLELMIVITILLSLAFLISIRNNNEGILLESSAQEMVSAIRLARQKYDAGDSMAKFQIIYKNGQHYFQVLERGPKTAVDIPIDKSVILSKKIISDSENAGDDFGFISLGTMPIEIRFSGENATGTSFLLEGKNTQIKYKITVVPTSSRVHIYKINKN